MSLINSGIYHIGGIQGSCLAFTNPTPRTNVTFPQCSNPSVSTQQWVISPYNSTDSYVVRNYATQGYMGVVPNAGWQPYGYPIVGEVQTPQPWYPKLQGDQYVFCPTPQCTLYWNVGGGRTTNTALILYPANDANTFFTLTPG